MESFQIIRREVIGEVDVRPGKGPSPTSTALRAIAHYLDEHESEPMEIEFPGPRGTITVKVD